MCEQKGGLQGGTDKGGESPQDGEGREREGRRGEVTSSKKATVRMLAAGAGAGCWLPIDWKTTGCGRTDEGG